MKQSQQFKKTWILILSFLVIFKQTKYKVKNSFDHFKLCQKLKLNINNSAAWLWQFL